MDITPNSSNSLISTTTSVFGDNVQDLLNGGLLNLKPTGIIVVNSSDDVLGKPGATTLRDAIVQANADSGEDLIVFERSLFSNAQTITLNLGELDITHSLDIIAPTDELTGTDLVTVSGNKASRVFEIEKDATVNLSGLIVADGSVTDDNGGGIKNSGTLTLDSSIVRNNSVSSRSGGGLSFALGGGIYNTGTSTVSNSTISDNSATQSGGGIYNSGISGSVSTVSNSTISGNQGAGISGSVSTVSNSTISGNQGSGISGNVTVTNSTISGNQGYGIIGGGTVTNSTISGNSSDGIYCLNNSLTLNNSTINDNQGRGIYSQFSFGEGGPYGKAILVSNSIINNNRGNGIYFTSNGNVNPVTVLNSTISGNSTGIYQQGGRSLTVTDSTISDNSALQNGGGIYLGNVGLSTVMTVTNSTISGNSAGGSGGGIYGNGTVTNSTISGNSAGGSGGGIDGVSTVTNTTISGNSALQNGGGIDGVSTVTNSTISGNSASQNGGGIYGSGTVTNSTISGNSALQNGGGIYNDYTRTLTLLFSTLTQNIAANGGGVYQNDVPLFSTALRGAFNVRNTIIAANLNSANGVNPDVEGTFASNGYNLIGDGTGSAGFGEATWDIVGTSDWVIDPRLAPLDFYGGSTQTLALLPDSPAILSADPIILATDPITDQRGLPRRAANGRADIGAFQLS